MKNQTDIATRRARLRDQLFPNGVPLLWCPPLAHYDGEGAIDEGRIRAHLRHLAPHTRGLLVPGSTGDGWEMNEREIRQVLEIALDEAGTLGLQVLVGALKTDERDAMAFIRNTLGWLQTRTGLDTLKSAHQTRTDTLKGGHPIAPVCGFTVCAPRGREKSQEEIGEALEAILNLGLPTALYQLPQVTQNEIGAGLASDLAMRFENFVLFKDSSGADQVVLSGQPLGGVFTVRGGEGDYARWLSLTGGPYNGFLLGSANCFAAELQRVIQDIKTGALAAARQLSDRLTAVMNAVSRSVADLPDGNVFANANKAIDHYFAWGPGAVNQSPPRLHAGSCLPIEVVRAAGDSLARHGLMPARGYL